MPDGIFVTGAGLAGCEAAYQAAKRGVKVTLYEMKPEKYSPAHHNPDYAELVCSNSLRSLQLTNAVGLLKEEMRRMGSLIIEAADRTQVPAGAALAVDREKFSAYITEKIKNDPLITVISGERTDYDPSQINVIATGPLTSEPMSKFITSRLGHESLSFFDAAAPIVSAESIDMSKAYAASRYGKGEACYLNCPMDKDEYLRFYEALLTAQTASLKEFDRESLKVFEGCMPVEVMAQRGVDTLRFRPMKPVGLPDPKTGLEPYAVLQLRRENREGTMYNLVGFQTHLTFGEQKRVFGMIPGLENAEFLRYGVMHRNTYLDSPRLLNADYSLIDEPNTFFAGQMTGVEGYVESASSGFVAGINAANRVLGKEPFILPQSTAVGALGSYISCRSVTNFQPMNVNFGIIAPLESKVKGGKAKRYEALSERALAVVDKAITDKTF